MCGAASTQRVLLSTFMPGGCTLELRRQSMAPLDVMIQECPSCHYCNPRIDEASGDLLALVNEPEYWRIMECHGDVGGRFEAAAWLAQRRNDASAAAVWFLHAAWAMDDQKRADRAASAREKAAECLMAADAGPESDPDSQRLVLVDVLRRIGRFGEALARCDPPPERPELRAAFEYEKDLLASGDTREHWLRDALEAKAPELLAAAPTYSARWPIGLLLMLLSVPTLFAIAFGIGMSILIRESSAVSWWEWANRFVTVLLASFLAAIGLPALVVFAWEKVRCRV